jgi:hypothetical protein
MDGHVNRYDGEPLEPRWVADHVKRILAGKPLELEVTEDEAKEIAYHYLRTHNGEKLRPVKFTRESSNGHGEPTWNIELAERATGTASARMKVGVSTGSTYSYEKLASEAK